MPDTLRTAYERLRAEVLGARARPEALGAVIHHGLLKGLGLVGGAHSAGERVAVATPAPYPVAQDRELLHALANMLLQTQSESTHVL